jgi:hypothetical protein
VVDVSATESSTGIPAVTGSAARDVVDVRDAASSTGVPAVTGSAARSVGPLLFAVQLHVPQNAALSLVWSYSCSIQSAQRAVLCH